MYCKVGQILVYPYRQPIDNVPFIEKSFFSHCSFEKTTFPIIPTYQSSGVGQSGVSVFFHCMFIYSSAIPYSLNFSMFRKYLDMQCDKISKFVLGQRLSVCFTLLYSFLHFPSFHIFVLQFEYFFSIFINYKSFLQLCLIGY